MKEIHVLVPFMFLHPVSSVVEVVAMTEKSDLPECCPPGCLCDWFLFDVVRVLLLFLFRCVSSSWF